MLAWIGAFVVAIPFILFISVLGIMWRAWWLFPAWKWFIVPLGVADISFWHFAGLLVIVGVLTAHTNTKKDDRSEDWSLIAVSFLSPVIAWAVMKWIAS